MFSLQQTWLLYSVARSLFFQSFLTATLKQPLLTWLSPHKVIPHTNTLESTWYSFKRKHRYSTVPPRKAFSGTESKLVLCSVKTLALLPSITFKFHAFRLKTFHFSSNHFLKSAHNTHICHKLLLCSFEVFLQLPHSWQELTPGTNPTPSFIHHLVCMINLLFSKLLP